MIQEAKQHHTDLQWDTIGLFLYPMKASENQRFSDVVNGYRNKSVA